jgi:hypothetical protein
VPSSGDFVENVLSGSDNIERPRPLRKIPLSELVKKIASLLKTECDEILSGNRRRKNCHARDLISFVASKSPPAIARTVVWGIHSSVMNLQGRRAAGTLCISGTSGQVCRMKARSKVYFKGVERSLLKYLMMIWWLMKRKQA